MKLNWIKRWRRISGVNANYEASPSVVSGSRDEAINEDDYRRHDRIYKDRQTVTNYAIASFTIVTAVVSFWQGCMTRTALRDAEESGRTSTEQLWRAVDNLNWQARETMKSANAVQSEARTSASALSISQRAYLSVETPENPLGLFGLLALPIQNYGHSICKGFIIRLTYERNKKPPLPPPPRPDGGSSFVYSADTKKLTVATVTMNKSVNDAIPPGASGYKIVVRIPDLKNNDIVAINTGEQILSVNGKIIYDTGLLTPTL